MRVKDLGPALEFYKDVIGLHEIASEDGIVFLGCGYDDNYDLAIRGGGTGVVHFALRVPNEDVLDHYRSRLAEQGIGTEDVDGREPGQEKGIRFEIPGGHQMELVLVSDNRYIETYRPVRAPRGIAPLDSDHINLMSTDVRGISEFLRDVLNCKLSDVIELDDGRWAASWVRMSPGHHDIGVFGTESDTETLHHVAFSFSSFDHMKLGADLLVQSGVKLELGMSRHPVGANLYAYFWEPGGNRFEFNAEGAILDERTPTRFWQGFEDTLDAWGNPIPPETFPRGS